MTQGASWADLNNTKVGEVKAPSLLPVGHYMGLITGQPETGNSAKKQTPFVTFQVKLTEALGDVDQDELNALEGNPLDKTRDLTYYLSPNALFMLTDLVKSLGGSDQMTIMESIEWLAGVGEPIVVQITHEPNERNPERPFVRINNAVAATAYEASQAAAA